MNVQQLRHVVRERRADVIPFVGSGLSLAAGAPTASRLTGLLASDLRLPETPKDLGALAKQCRQSGREAELQSAVAAIFSGYRMRPTPPLTAVALAPGRVVLTTNYDDAVEVAVHAAGLFPVALDVHDPAISTTPDPHHVHVVHIHGLPERPETIVLPGHQMFERSDDDVARTYLRALLAPRDVLYLGFSFAEAEVHLTQLLGWLAVSAKAQGRQWLLAPRRQVQQMERQYATLESTGLLELVVYDGRLGHDDVATVASALAPRTTERERGLQERLPYCWPVLLRVAAGDSADTMRSKVSSLDFTEQSSDYVGREQLFEAAATVVVAAPGMGKSELVHRLARWAPPAGAAVGELKNFRNRPGWERSELLISLLRQPADDEPMPVEALDTPGLLVVLDGLDEVPDEERATAVASIVAARKRWPKQRWVVTTRPDADVDVLRDAGFDTVQIVASRLWANAYMRARAVPEKHLKSAMLDRAGLRDLLAVPMFARHLADRMLDGDQLPEPLELLTDSQGVALRKEARRRHVREDALGDWVERLAAGLHLRNRSAASESELSSGLSQRAGDARTVREGLVRASVLGDVAGVASFPSRTLQEATVAARILASRDVAGALTWCAAAEVLGVLRIRHDWEFVADLVFEHGTQRTREKLKALDPQRWARTVVTRGTKREASEALTMIIRDHETRRVPFHYFSDIGGLRTPRAAAKAIVARWPQLVRDRRDELIKQLNSDQLDVRERALVLLGALPTDRRTLGWLLPLISDRSPAIAVASFQLARALRIEPALPLLIERFSDENERVREAALRAAADLLPDDRLDELGSVRSPSTNDPLMPVAKVLRERCDIDTALRLLKIAEPSPTTALLLEHLAATTSSSAWSEKRIRAFVRACRDGNGFGRAAPERLLPVFSLNVAAAIAETQIHHTSAFGGGWWGPHSQLGTLALLDDGQLRNAGASDDFIEAVTNERTDRAEIHERLTAHERRAEQLAQQLDTLTADEELVRVGCSMEVRQLNQQQREKLEAAIARSWALLETLESESQTLYELASLSRQLNISPPPSAWNALLRLHLKAVFDYELGGWETGAWLAASRTPVTSATLAKLVTKSSLSKLVKIVRICAQSSDTPLLELATERLQQEREVTSDWIEIAGTLAADDARARTLKAWALDLPPSAANDRALRQLNGHLARRGDPEAQTASLRFIEREIAAGADLEMPFPDPYTAAPQVIEALAALTDTALSVGNYKAARYAVGRLDAIATVDSARAIAVLATDSHPYWMRDAATQSARRAATTIALGTLPDDIGACADELDQRFPRRRRLSKQQPADVEPPASGP